jgi:hypothetical protein
MRQQLPLAAGLLWKPTGRAFVAAQEQDLDEGIAPGSR